MTSKPLSEIVGEIGTVLTGLVGGYRPAGTPPSAMSRQPDEPARPEPCLVVWWTCSVNLLEHGVAIAEAEASVSQPGSVCRALCGRCFTPAAMSTAPTGRCRTCGDSYARSREAIRAPRRMRRRLRALVPRTEGR